MEIERWESFILVITLELLRLVLARRLAFPWAVVEPIGLGSHIVVIGMVPGIIVNLQAGAAHKP
jgi:hypothetical protein